MFFSFPHENVKGNYAQHILMITVEAFMTHKMGNIILTMTRSTSKKKKKEFACAQEEFYWAEGCEGKTLSILP